MRVRLFRWKAVGPLLGLLVVLAVLAALFAEPVARETAEDAGSDLLGTEVDVAKLDLYPRETAVELRGLQVADPFEPRRNLVEAAELRLRLDPAALIEKKIVAEEFVLSGMRFGTARTRPARPSAGGGFAPRLVRAMREWVGRFDVPLLSLTPIDTVRQLVLNPGQLASVRAAQGLAARTDSTCRALEQGFRSLDLGATVDSARALADRLQGADPRTLGLQGTRDAIVSVRATLAALDSTRRRIGQLEQRVRGAVDLLGSGLQALDSARQRDHAFARSLLKLPSFEAPDLGKAFFGKVSIERFQQAVYWVELARQYMPPGLLPREVPGPDRLRMAGTTVHFPKEHRYPSFLLELGRIDFAVGGDKALRGAYQATVRGLTTAPALYGRPTVISATRTARGSAIEGIEVSAVIDHLGPRPRDSVAARARGVRLPAIDLPGVPFRVEPGVGTSELVLALQGDRLLGRWAIGSDRVRWARDTASRPLNTLEQVVWRILSGLSELRVAAEVSGTLARPELSVSSNLDRAVADRLTALVGEEVARAERLARAKVDSLVADRVEPVRRQIAAVQADATRRIAGERERVEEVRRRLEAELKRLAGPAGELIPLPKLLPP